MRLDRGLALTLPGRLREALKGLLRPGQGGVDGRRRHGLALEAASHAGHVVLERVHESLRLVAGRLDRLVALATGLAALLVGGPEGLGRLGLGDAGPFHGDRDLALLLADGRERGLERCLVLRETAARVGDDGVRQPEALRDGEGLRPARQPDREAIRGRERLQVELHRRVAGRRRLVGVDLDLRVVRRGRHERPGADEVVQERLGQR